MLQKRLDFISVSNGLQYAIKDVQIGTAFSSDHSLIKMSVIDPKNTRKGPGLWKFNTIKPGIVQLNKSEILAPHIWLWIVARGINLGLYTCMYFGDENALNKLDRNLKKLVSIKSWATCGVDPALMGTGPIPSSKKALDLAGWKIVDVDLFEVNEAFAVVPMAVMKDIGISNDILNIYGGACALGHPVGASGTRIVTTLINALKKNKSFRKIAMYPYCLLYTSPSPRDRG